MLEDKIEIEEKRELLVKQLKSCERNMQELSNSIKRPNMRLMGIEEGEEVKAKGIHNISNKIIIENFPHLFFFFVIAGLEIRTYTLSHSTSPFYFTYF
jgi:hypothetical protein